jgi:hypothetical protein
MRFPDYLEDCFAPDKLSVMKVASFEAIVRALNDAEVPFIVVGGIAVNTHGYGRVTFDVDLVINLEPEKIRWAFSALAAIGYAPSVPIAAEQFADPERRQDWIINKQMTVLRFWSDAHRETPLGVFVKEPFENWKSTRRWKTLPFACSNTESARAFPTWTHTRPR